MVSVAVKNFLKQQGFEDEPDDACDMHMTGLYFQPWIVGPLVVLGIVLQSATFFYVLSLVLWWNVLFPRWNPFERFYNLFFAGARGKLPLAPPPRRFAQGMAAAFMIMATIGLLLESLPLIWISEGFLVLAFSALLFGKFCFGAYVYHLLRGKIGFANSTLPWARR